METISRIAWSDLGLSPQLLQLIEETGYKHPSDVQAQTIPLALQGLDVLVSSQTGSGKTASFVIPTIERFKDKNGTYILALSPTREIAQQTGAVFEAFGKPFGLKTVVCIGGANMNQEKEALASSPHIIVATPGRLCDHLERGNVWLDFIQCLIFDEADRMLEMGFAKQIDLITESIPKNRQTLMLSATFAPQVEKLARKSMNDPKQVIIAKTETSTPKIEQTLFWISEGQKLGYLMRLLRDEPGTVFVFVKAKERAYQLWRDLAHKGFEDVTYIHSDLPQDKRELAVADFKSGKYRVIIATDVMGRGIDVDDVAHVVNYDVPREAADYIHRIGRTGRRGKTGHATTFAVPDRDDKSIAAIGKLRGVPAPAKDAPVERPRDDRPRDSRPRNDRPRDDRPRGDRPRNERPRGARPQGDRPRQDSRPRQDQAPKPQAQVTAPSPEVMASAKPKGLVARFLSLFKK